MIQKFINRLDEQQKEDLLKVSLEELEVHGAVVFPKDGSEPTMYGEEMIDGL